MPFSVICGACGKRIKVPDSAAGKEKPCPSCKNPIHIPTLEESKKYQADQKAVQWKVVAAQKEAATAVTLAGLGVVALIAAYQWALVGLIVLCLEIPALIKGIHARNVLNKHKVKAGSGDALAAIIISGIILGLWALGALIIFGK